MATAAFAPRQIAIHVATMLGLAVTVTAAPCASAQRPASWTIEPRPALVLGRGASDGELFSAVAGATRLPDGRIIVGDRGAYALRLFDANGALVRQFGRKGKGPGEIDFLVFLLRCGDRLLTFDVGGDRTSIFSLDGAFERTFRFSRKVYRASCNGQQQFALMGWPKSGEIDGKVTRPASAFWIADTTGAVRAELGDLPSSERFGFRPLPLGREPRVAMGAERAYVATADSLTVLAFDASGRRLGPLRASWTPVPVSSADFQAEREREVAMMGDKFREIIERDYARMPRPKSLPATRDLVVDADDNLWVQQYPSASQPTVQWTVFSRAGKRVASVRLPTDFELYEAGRDYVLGRYVDANEAIPEVRMYRLSRR